MAGPANASAATKITHNLNAARIYSTLAQAQVVVDPLLARGPDPLVQRLRRLVVRRRLPGQLAGAALGCEPAAFLDQGGSELPGRARAGSTYRSFITARRPASSVSHVM